MASKTIITEQEWSINDGPRFIRTITPISILVTLCVALRFRMRQHKGAGIGLDDWLTLASLVLSWGSYTIGACLVSMGGLGRPMVVNVAIDPRQPLILAKILFAGELIYASCISATKLGILALYWRIFPTRFMKIGCSSLAVLSAMWWTIVLFASVFQCDPIARSWDPTLAGHCMQDAGSFVDIIARLEVIIPNIIVDVLILLLPIYEIRKLQITGKQRLALIFVFMLGGLITAASGVRLYYQTHLTALGGEIDVTMDMYQPVLWSVLEPNLAVVCACLPVLRPLASLSCLKPIYCRFASKKTSNYGKKQDIAGLQTIGGTTIYDREHYHTGTAQQPRQPALSSIDSLEEYELDDLLEIPRPVYGSPERILSNSCSVESCVAIGTTVGRD